jgi:hypothetical protein
LVTDLSIETSDIIRTIPEAVINGDTQNSPCCHEFDSYFTVDCARLQSSLWIASSGDILRQETETKKFWEELIAYSP